MAAGLEGMAIRTEFPRRIRTYDDWIPLADGCRVQVRIWLPEDAEQDPVPALFEQIPYRMDDAMAITETIRHPYLAGYGYASARVDIRGSGNSDGLLVDEYLEQEQDDALEIIAWLAAQPWCTGKVGMYGLSWGGFASLQVAARRPPALGAIIAFGATHDRYLDDVHYNGGCIHQGMLGWGSQMFAFDARPPDPAVVGDRWREMWFQRMEQAPALETWLAHQRYDDYWKHGSVKEVYDQIECPVYMVSGWADNAAYRNPVLAVLEGVSVPCKGIIGAWGHDYPDEGSPGPTIGFLQECVRFYDRWLKGIENGIEDEPKLIFWMPDPPGGPELQGEGGGVRGTLTGYEVPGRWVAEPEWPSDNVTTRTLHLNADGLAAEPAGEEPLAVLGFTTAGVETSGPGVTIDQRADDSRWLCFDSRPLEERWEIFGNPYVELALASDRPVASVAVRLCDVAPDGVSTQITRGVLNLTHRDSHEEPTPLEPGKRYTARVRLDVQARVVSPGHRLRVAVSPSYWPRIWPAPEQVTLTVFAGSGCKLEVPVRAPRPEDAELREFGPPEGSAPRPHEVIYSRSTTPDHFLDSVTRDMVSGRVEHRQGRAVGFRFTDDGLLYSQRVRSSSSSIEGNPLSTQQRIEHTIVLRRGSWDIRVETETVLSTERDSFLLTNRVEGYESDGRVFTKTFTRRIPRDLV